MKTLLKAPSTWLVIGLQNLAKAFRDIFDPAQWLLIAATPGAPGIIAWSMPSIPRFEKHSDSARQGSRQPNHSTENASLGRRKPSESISSQKEAMRPWHVAVVNSALCDLQIIAEKGGSESPLLHHHRCWVHMLSDRCNRVLAFSLSFEAPSYRTILALIRECGRRHNQLPEVLWIPNGCEFNSADLSACLATHGLVAHRPPTSSPALEKHPFGCDIASALQRNQFTVGATRSTRQPTEIWRLEDLRKALEIFFYEIYDLAPVGDAGQTRREAYANQIQIAGQAGCPVVFNEQFVFTTLEAAPRGTGWVARSGGIKLRDLRYWAPALEGVAAQRVPVCRIMMPAPSFTPS